MRAYTLFVVHQMIWLWLALPVIAQETSTHVIPPGCHSTTIPATSTQPGSVTIQCPKLTITTPISLPGATQNKIYNVNIAPLVNPHGGAPPYSYTLLTGPSWMTMTLSGTVMGTPNATGNVTFTFKVTDSFQKLTEIFEGNFNVARIQLICSGKDCGVLYPIFYPIPQWCIGDYCVSHGPNVAFWETEGRFDVAKMDKSSRIIAGR